MVGMRSPLLVFSARLSRSGSLYAMADVLAAVDQDCMSMAHVVPEEPQRLLRQAVSIKNLQFSIDSVVHAVQAARPPHALREGRVALSAALTSPLEVSIACQ